MRKKKLNLMSDEELNALIKKMLPFFEFTNIDGINRFDKMQTVLLNKKKWKYTTNKKYADKKWPPPDPSDILYKKYRNTHLIDNRKDRFFEDFVGLIFFSPKGEIYKIGPNHEKISYDVDKINRVLEKKDVSYELLNSMTNDELSWTCDQLFAKAINDSFLPKLKSRMVRAIHLNLPRIFFSSTVYEKKNRLVSVHFERRRQRLKKKYLSILNDQNKAKQKRLKESSN